MDFDLNFMRRKFFIIIGIILVVLIIRAALPWYDTDHTYQIVANHYGYKGTLRPNFYQKISCENEVDGVGVKAVPFGVVLESCNSSWFVFLNSFPVPIKVDANLF
jgi:hypothetical protein